MNIYVRIPIYKFSLFQAKIKINLTIFPHTADLVQAHAGTRLLADRVFCRMFYAWCDQRHLIRYWQVPTSPAPNHHRVTVSTLLWITTYPDLVWVLMWIFNHSPTKHDHVESPIERLNYCPKLLEKGLIWSHFKCIQIKINLRLIRGSVVI